MGNVAKIYHGERLGSDYFDNGVKFGSNMQFKCKECGKVFNHASGEIFYVVKDGVCCSWTCKCRYLRKHPDETVNKAKSFKNARVKKIKQEEYR